jgi:hypothetical protein
MMVDVKTGRAFAASSPRALFQTRALGFVGVGQRSFRDDVARDGQRFLINTPAEESNTAPITVVCNCNPK